VRQVPKWNNLGNAILGIGLALAMVAVFFYAKLGGHGAVFLIFAVFAIWFAGTYFLYPYISPYELVYPSDPPCQHCGYDPKGNTSGVCPECGRPTGREQS